MGCPYPYFCFCAFWGPKKRLSGLGFGVSVCGPPGSDDTKP